MSGARRARVTGRWLAALLAGVGATVSAARPARADHQAEGAQAHREGVRLLREHRAPPRVRRVDRAGALALGLGEALRLGGDAAGAQAAFTEAARDPGEVGRRAAERLRALR